jgi:hypothetical protein
MAAISIQWSELLRVAGVSVAFGVGVVVVFAIGALALTRVEAARNGGGALARTTGFAMAGLAFLTCAAAVGFGIYLLVPQFHG